jgi:hypothetical protein
MRPVSVFLLTTTACSIAVMFSMFSCNHDTVDAVKPDVTYYAYSITSKGPVLSTFNVSSGATAKNALTLPKTYMTLLDVTVFQDKIYNLGYYRLCSVDATNYSTLKDVEYPDSLGNFYRIIVTDNDLFLFGMSPDPEFKLSVMTCDKTTLETKRVKLIDDKIVYNLNGLVHIDNTIFLSYYDQDGKNSRVLGLNDKTLEIVTDQIVSGYVLGLRAGRANELVVATNKPAVTIINTVTFSSVIHESEKPIGRLSDNFDYTPENSVAVDPNSGSLYFLQFSAQPAAFIFKSLSKMDLGSGEIKDVYNPSAQGDNFYANSMEFDAVNNQVLLVGLEYTNDGKVGIRIIKADGSAVSIFETAAVPVFLSIAQK